MPHSPTSLHVGKFAAVVSNTPGGVVLIQALETEGNGSQVNAWGAAEVVHALVEQLLSELDADTLLAPAEDDELQNIRAA